MFLVVVLLVSLQLFQLQSILIQEELQELSFLLPSSLFLLVLLVLLVLLALPSLFLLLLQQLYNHHLLYHFLLASSFDFPSCSNSSVLSSTFFSLSFFFNSISSFNSFSTTSIPYSFYQSFHTHYIKIMFF